MADETLQLRCGEQVFSPVTIEQIKTLLNAEKLQDGDCVREGEGPWVLVREFLAWKEQADTRVADIAALLGGVQPVSQTTPATSQPLPSLSSELPLAEELAAESSDSKTKHAQPSGKDSGKPSTASEGQSKPDRKQPAKAAATKPVESEKASSSSDADALPSLPAANPVDDYVPLFADDESPESSESHSAADEEIVSLEPAPGQAKQAKTRNVQSKSRPAKGRPQTQPRKSGKLTETQRKASPAKPSKPVVSEASPTASGVAIETVGDLDAVLRAMAEYEQKAPPFKPKAAGKSSASIRSVSPKAAASQSGGRKATRRPRRSN